MKCARLVASSLCSSALPAKPRLTHHAQLVDIVDEQAATVSVSEGFSQNVKSQLVGRARCCVRTAALELDEWALAAVAAGVEEPRIGASLVDVRGAHEDRYVEAVFFRRSR
jgi:hypothetical protein